MTDLHEGFRPIEQPQNERLRQLLALWHDRPEDGLIIGRDIPSRRFAPLLSHILLWEPIDDGANYRLKLCGDALRRRFGNNAVGKLFTDLIDPQIVPAFLAGGKAMLAKDDHICFDMHLVRDEPVEGHSELHFELVIFPVWSRHRAGRCLLNGIYYFQ